MKTLIKSALLVGISLAASISQAGGFVWLEGEAGKSNVAVQSGETGIGILSGGQWLQYSVEEGKIEKDIPAEGILIQYPFSITQAASYEIWNRIGYEFVRSSFDWSLDGGEWKTAHPDDLTTDLMEISFFREVAWLKLGDLSLPAGPHTLTIRLPKNKKENGKFNRILYASDAICLHEGPFHPNSKFKPDETGRTGQDEAASRNVFVLPDAKPGERSSIALGGQWEVTRDDEQMPGEVAEPIKGLPTHTAFTAIPVPSDKNKSRPDLVFAHRLWYRTRVNVPASLAGRSFMIDFPLNNLNTTVYVNGTYCGFEKNPFCRFSVDVTRGIKPGQVNEIWVGIRDTWYARSADPARPLKLRKTFNVPIRFFSNGFQDLDYPVWNCPQAGILATPTLSAAGRIYVSDLFVKPSVARKTLDTEVTLNNTTDTDQTGEIRQEALDGETGKVVKTFKGQPFTLPAGKSTTLTLSGSWTDPHLWWPDSPTLYRLRTTLVKGATLIDTHEIPFGFREWVIQGTQFTLNGVPWRMWADVSPSGSTTNQWLASFTNRNMRTHRFSTAGQAANDPHWYGMEPHTALDFFDRNGVVIRRNATLDGETIGSNFIESDPVTVKQQGGSTIKKALMKNWLEQCVAQVKGERNHPSIQIWSIENEFAFINLINLLGNSPAMDEYEREIKKTHDAVMAIDPTRSVMTDGGGAMKENTLGVCGDHYLATLDTRYPDLAYEPFVEGAGRGRWQWDMKRPRFMGEDFFATGMDPADFAAWGGEVTFQGKAAIKDAVATCYRMLTEGYRWGGYYAAWHFWLFGEGGEAQWVANAPRAVFCRQWDWTFGSGQTINRTFGVFNDTQYPDPLTFTRTLTVKGKTVYSKTTTHKIAPGSVEKFDEPITMPAVKARTEGELRLELTVAGKPLFHDVKAVSILPPAVFTQKIKSDALAVFDPQNSVIPFLTTAKIPFTPLTALANLPANARVLLIGSDALAASDSTSPALAAYASSGHAVIVLDQTFPLKYQALPAEMEPVSNAKEVWAANGRTGYIEDSSHPVLQGFADKDFFTWNGPDSLLYRNAYVKPEKGGKSLIQVGPRLGQTALVEIPTGKGLILLSQLRMGDRLASNAVARQILLNMISCSLVYKQEFAAVSAFIQDEQLGKALDAMGLQYAKAADPLAAISDPARKIAVISATPASLATLAKAMPTIEAFWKRGGTIIFHGLTPEGLADYNKIVGVEHVIRPFIRERVQFPAIRNPLTAGLSSGDIVMLSGKRVFGFREEEFTVPDEFTYVVDYDEIAPFGKSDFASYDKIVNGFIGADGWPQIIDFGIPENDQPFPIKITLPKAETITEITYDPSVNYNPTTKIALLFDGKDRQEFVLPPDGDPRTFAVTPPRQARELTLELREWQVDPAKTHNAGIDNIWIKVQRSPEFHATVKPMLNVGGMMQYVKGPGGVVLCNLNFQENEAVPLNKIKKRNVLATVLRNLKASFSGGKTVIVGANLAFTPVDIHTKATTYKDERGWFGNKSRTFAGLPAGVNKMAGVKFSIYEMPTSPVPQVLMLGGNGIPGNLPAQITGIPVNLKADALFFLHTARIGTRLTDKDRREKKAYLMFKYVVTYADGQTAEVPIRSEIDIENYVQKIPATLPGAQTSWILPYEASDEKAVAYTKQWNNPRPEVEIQSVDIIPVDPTRGIPVLLALTAARTE
ncbi:MAG: glycoside hydrolase family 2 TIM barrel-domain containing protein [bacterium]